MMAAWVEKAERELRRERAKLERAEAVVAEQKLRVATAQADFDRAEAARHMGSAAKGSTYLELIEGIVRSARRPVSNKEIAVAIEAGNHRPETPRRLIEQNISVCLNSNRDKFHRVRRGLYSLAPSR